VRAGFSAVFNAIRDAVGDNAMRRSPVTLDVILTSLEEDFPLDRAFPVEHRLRTDV